MGTVGNSFLKYASSLNEGRNSWPHSKRELDTSFPLCIFYFFSSFHHNKNDKGDCHPTLLIKLFGMYTRNTMSLIDRDATQLSVFMDDFEFRSEPRG